MNQQEQSFFDQYETDMADHWDTALFAEGDALFGELEAGHTGQETVERFSAWLEMSSGREQIQAFFARSIMDACCENPALADRYQAVQQASLDNETEDCCDDDKQDAHNNKSNGSTKFANDQKLASRRRAAKRTSSIVDLLVGPRAA